MTRSGYVMAAAMALCVARAAFAASPAPPVTPLEPTRPYGEEQPVTPGSQADRDRERRENERAGREFMDSLSDSIGGLGGTLSITPFPKQENLN